MTDTNLFDISAECLLNYLYPDMADLWQVECAGTFYRNYSKDIMSVDEENRTVTLSRDSFLNLLPEGIIADEKSLKGKDFEQKYKMLKKKEELLRDMFKPVDTLSFRFRLHIEKEAAQLSREIVAILLKRYYNFDIYREENPYIRQTAPLLLQISRLRANYPLVRSILAYAFKCKVEMHKGKYAWEEDETSIQPAIEYKLLIPGLTIDTYSALEKELEPFGDFIREWFIPFDTKCSITIKDDHEPSVLGPDIILNYNTEINTGTQHATTTASNKPL